MPTTLTIATRQSPLALWQAEHIKARLQQLHAGIHIQLLGITTDGDRFLETDLSQLGGKGVFVKALEEALLSGQADIAVHSMKDVPIELPDGLIMHCICKRAAVADALVSNHYAHLDQLPLHARIGTSSLRRHSQLKHYRADFTLMPLRGNVQTRLQKLDAGEFDAIILAAAGLERLGLQSRIRHYLDQQVCLSAVGQGALGIECRADDLATQHLIASLNDAPTHAAVLAERKVNAELGGSCHAPIGAWASWQQHQLTLQAMVGSIEGQQRLWASASVAIMDANPLSPASITPILALGTQVAEQLKAQGAMALLAQSSAKS